MNIANMSIDEIWEKISLKTEEEPDIAGRLNATYTFHIKEDEQKSFSLIFKNGKATVQKGSIENANCELSMKESNFKKLLMGDLNATSAFMTGRLKLKGNIGDALKLEQILKNFSF